MVKMLISLGKWLERRFPERVVVTPEAYNSLLSRVQVLESSSVHKEAVKTLILKVKDLQDEFNTVKSGLGLASPKTREIMAMLNGEPVGIQEGEESI